MASPKVFLLIKSMDSDDLMAIDKVVSSHKRPSLKKLLKLINNTDASAIDKLDKAFAYAQVFGKKYTAQQDYVWRNELRLLMDIAEEYVAGKMMKEEWVSSEALRSRYFLKYLVSKNLYPLVLSESERLKKDAAAAYDYNSVIDACAILFPYLDNHSWNNTDAQEVMEVNNSEYSDAINRLYLQSHRKAQIARYGSTLYKYKENFKPVSPEPGLSRHFVEYEDPYTEYLSLRLLTMALPNMIDPEIYRKCLAHLERYPNIPRAQREKFMLLNNLSAYYFFRYDYEQALMYNKEQLGIMDQVEDGLAIMLVYNYISTLAHLERYDEAVAAIKDYQTFIRRFPNQTERFKYMEASCYALRGDKKMFNKLLPKQFDELSRMMQHHYRMLIAVSHFLDKEYALALTEVSNIGRSIKNQKSEKLNYQDGVSVAAEHLGIFFDIYQKYQLDGDRHKANKKIDAFENEIGAFMTSQPLSGGLLFYMWMRKQLSGLKEKIS